MKWKKAPEELAVFLAQKMKSVDCEYGKMFGYPACFINGNMFVGLFEDMLFLRLSESDRREIMQIRPDVTPFEPRPARAAKEYLLLPKKLYSNEKLFDKWLKKSVQYTLSLPTKKKNITN